MNILSFDNINLEIFNEINYENINNLKLIIKNNINFDYNKLIKKCIINNNIEILKLLYKNNFKIKFKELILFITNISGLNYNFLELIKFLIDEYKDDFDICFYNNYLIKQATINNYLDIIQFIFENSRINFNTIGWIVSTASDNDYQDIIKYLLEKNYIYFDYKGNYILYAFIKNNNTEMIKYLTKNKDFIVNKKYSFKLLKNSIINNNLELTKYLIEKLKIDPHYKNDKYLFYSIKHYNFDIMVYLIENHNLNYRMDNDAFIKIFTKYEIYDKFFDYLIFYYVNKEFINFKNDKFNIYRFNNCNNYKSQELFDKYQLLKNDIIKKAKLINYYN